MGNDRRGTNEGKDHNARAIWRDRLADERVTPAQELPITDGGFYPGFFEQVVEEVGVGVGVYDETGEFTYVNEAYADLLDREKATLVGTPVWEVNPTIQPARFDQYWDSFEVGETRQTETIHRRSDGAEFPVETHTTAIESEGTRYHVGTITNISERVEGWRKLERQDERLEQFASVVSHDLRNPLNVAMGRLRLAMDECESEHLDPVENSLERMEALIDDVLTLAREGSRLTEPEPVSLRETVERAWAITDEETATLELEDGLGVVESDKSRLGEIFENLFRNAIEHAGRDVTVRVGPLDDESGFFVEDDGPGIDPDVRDDVFEYGYSTNERGTGFGLAIVEQIADAHGWDVELVANVSDDGRDDAMRGARFEFRKVEIE